MITKAAVRTQVSLCWPPGNDPFRERKQRNLDHQLQYCLVPLLAKATLQAMKSYSDTEIRMTYCRHTFAFSSVPSTIPQSI